MVRLWEVLSCLNMHFVTRIHHIEIKMKGLEENLKSFRLVKMLTLELIYFFSYYQSLMINKLRVQDKALEYDMI